MIFSFFFKNSFRLRILVFESLFVAEYLERGGAVVFVGVLDLLVVLPPHRNEAHTRFDRVRSAVQ
jgi:hypothetical protein